MNGENHMLVTLIFVIPIGVTTNLINTGDIPILFFIALLPDVDHALMKKQRLRDLFGHRSAITHSIILPVMLLFGEIGTLEKSIIFVVSLHLLCDIKFKKRSGFYLINFCGKRIKFKWTNLWLIGNGLVGILLWVSL